MPDRVRYGVHGITDWLEVELGAMYDWYRWEVANSLSAQSSDFSAITLTGGLLGYGPRRTGLLIGAFMLTFTCLSYPMGRLADRFGLWRFGICLDIA